MADTVGYPRKRTQTRNRLIRAGLVVLGTAGPEAATVGAIAAEAGVAPGTFYNHFPTLVDLIDDIARRLGEGVEIGGGMLGTVADDPAVRVAIGTLQLLDITEVDPEAGAAFVTLLASKADFRNRIRHIVATAIQAGIDRGRFTVDDLTAMTNVVVGATVQSMRSRLLGETTADAAPEVARLVLRVLGVEPEDAAAAVAAAVAAARPAPEAASA